MILNTNDILCTYELRKYCSYEFKKYLDNLAFLSKTFSVWDFLGVLGFGFVLSPKSSINPNHLLLSGRSQPVQNGVVMGGYRCCIIQHLHFPPRPPHLPLPNCLKGLVPAKGVNFKIIYYPIFFR